MFDEVEHITYGKAVDEKWGKGLESVSFWKAIRSAYQLQDSKFTYCIVGTNPICIEYPTITHADNPIVGWSRFIFRDLMWNKHGAW